MKALQCARARRLVTRRRAGLSAAERLQIEEHLTGCATCAQEASALDALSRVIDEDAGGSRTSRHARAITRVLNTVSEAEMQAPTPPPRSAPYLFAGAMAVATVLGMVAYRAGWGSADSPSPAAPAAVESLAGPAAPPISEPAVEGEAPAGDRPSGDRFDVGDLRADGALVDPGDELRSDAELATESGATLSLGPALVELGAGGRAVWSAERTTLRLDAGIVRARVDPGESTGFRVVTEGFVVEVIGTSFEVTREGVEVVEGTVRITDREGEVLAARVEAGESWRPDVAGDEGPRAEREPAPAVATADKTLDVSESLTRARSLLAREDVSAARALIREALEASPSRVERAEAETLLAECALVAGDRARAARRYLAVADSYARLSAGENALFAAARLEHDLGRESRAVELFERYLQRYPSGRFREDAEHRLEEAHGR